jgi:cytochrome c oxidase subunit 3
MPIIQMIDKNLGPSRYQALRFGLWIGMASITMMFAAFTSAYVVRKPAGNWYEFKLPEAFFFSTIILLISSFTMEWAYKYYKKREEQKFKHYLLATLMFGLGFLCAQIYAWKSLFNQGITVDLNVSGSFLYLISGMHALHVLGGITVLVISVLSAFTFAFSPNSFKVLKLDLVRQYWHFVDILWIYLLIFLIVQ